MANVKISELPVVSSINSGDTLPLVQSGVTKRGTFSQLPFTQSGTGASTSTSQAKLREVMSVKDFGVTCDGSTDDTTAWATALSAANSAGVALFHPGGNSIITDAIDATSFFGVHIYGVGHNASPSYTGPSSRITQTGTNKAILKLWGPCVIQDLYLAYSAQQSTANTASLGLQLNNISGSSFQNIRIYRANTSVGIPQSAFGATTYNVVFDSVFINVQSYEASECHFDLRNFSGGGTNCRFDAIYINGGGSSDFVTTGQSANYAIRGVNWSGYEFGAVSIDGISISTQVIDLVNCYGTFNTIRTEAMTYTKDNDGWIKLGGSDTSMLFGLYEIVNCRALLADCPTSSYFFRSSATSTLLSVASIRATSTCTFTSPIVRPLTNTGATSGDIRFGVIKNNASGLTSTTWSDAASAPPYVVKLWDNQVVESILKAGRTTVVTNWHSATAAPVAGTWAVGDITWNATPTAGGTIGWVCTTAGSPGTWKTFGSIAA